VFALYMKTRISMAHERAALPRLPLLLDEQAISYAMTDPIAEAHPQGRRNHAEVHRQHRSTRKRVLDNDAEYVEPLDMLAELREDNKELRARFREAHNVCRRAPRHATASLSRCGSMKPSGAPGSCSRRAARATPPAIEQTAPRGA